MSENQSRSILFFQIYVGDQCKEDGRRCFWAGTTTDRTMIHGLSILKKATQLVPVNHIMGGPSSLAMTICAIKVYKDVRIRDVEEVCKCGRSTIARHLIELGYRIIVYRRTPHVPADHDRALCMTLCDSSPMTI
ncbi:hypothetical protein KIN20_018882 [Parelaphostrongylus tenuis]|uniref:Uncharacterized protein n=1 Tax=Parelaphostrongylus tenuis TaxID=148309 RepID=A0AAD5N1M5_PARTN|nr:hypothetical protein KIN20_018882 [Parelaphostrongylus tenuis]